jgi:twitching motility protein PilT
MSNSQIDQVLRFAVQHNVSDIHLKVGRPPIYRRDGTLVPHKGALELQPILIKEWIEHMGGTRHAKVMDDEGETDFGYSLEGVGRFRVNAFYQGQLPGMALRVIPTEAANFKELGLPDALQKMTEKRRGLVLVTGATGSGKSTTLTSMVDHINSTRACHILTIEDPLEFLHSDKKALVTQREIGRDTASFESALRAAMRQDPDVILIGELRDAETMLTAMNAAETGHLVLSTLHTVDASDTVSRIVGMFEPHHAGEIRRQLAHQLEGIVSQRLVPRSDGKGRIPACEVLVPGEAIREAISAGHYASQIRELMAKGQSTYGSQTMDQALVKLFQDGLISEETLYWAATNPNDVKLLLSGIS